MKIFLLYETTEAPWGGVNTFFRNFAKHAERSESVELVDSPVGADVVLTAGHYRGAGKPLRRFEARNAAAGRPLGALAGFFPWLDGSGGRGRSKLVFRLDGLRSVYAGDGVSAADERLLSNLDSADSAVFQSRFAEGCFERASAKIPEKSVVVLNGAESAVFHPAENAGSSAGPVRLLSVSWSRNPRKGFADIAEFSKLNGVAIRHVGRWPEGVDSADVELLETKSPAETADLLRDSRFLLFPSRDEACPNVVVEALACGVPVLYHDSGGTPELCGDGKYGLALPDDPADYADFLAEAENAFRGLRGRILEDIGRFSFQRCFEEYLEFFRGLGA